MAHYKSPNGSTQYVTQSATLWSSHMSPLFVIGPRGPSHGYVITNAFRKSNDLMVASYPCNEGGMLDMCVIGATSHEVGEALRSQPHRGHDRFVT